LFKSKQPTVEQSNEKEETERRKPQKPVGRVASFSDRLKQFEKAASQEKEPQEFGYRSLERRGKRSTTSESSDKEERRSTTPKREMEDIQESGESPARIKTVPGDYSSKFNETGDGESKPARTYYSLDRKKSLGAAAPIPDKPVNSGDATSGASGGSKFGFAEKLKQFELQQNEQREQQEAWNKSLERRKSHGHVKSKSTGNWKLGEERSSSPTEEKRLYVRHHSVERNLETEGAQSDSGSDSGELKVRQLSQMFEQGSRSRSGSAEPPSANRHSDPGRPQRASKVNKPWTAIL